MHNPATAEVAIPISHGRNETKTILIDGNHVIFLTLQLKYVKVECVVKLSNCSLLNSSQIAYRFKICKAPY